MDQPDQHVRAGDLRRGPPDVHRCPARGRAGHAAIVAADRDPRRGGGRCEGEHPAGPDRRPARRRGRCCRAAAASGSDRGDRPGPRGGRIDPGHDPALPRDDGWADGRLRIARSQLVVRLAGLEGGLTRVILPLTGLAVALVLWSLLWAGVVGLLGHRRSIEDRRILLLLGVCAGAIGAAVLFNYPGGSQIYFLKGAAGRSACSPRPGSPRSCRRVLATGRWPDVWHSRWSPAP